MKTHRVFMLVFFLLGQIISPLSVRAEESLEEQVRIMKEQFDVMKNRISELESKVKLQDEELSQYRTVKEVYDNRIEGLEGKLAQKADVSAVQPQDRNPTGKWIPEIGVVADVVGKLDSPKEDEEGADRISVRELELVLGSAIDPYSRLDATIAFSDFEDPSLEEAYMTHFGIKDTKLRLGKFKPFVGKAIPVHRDSLETVDEPLVIQRYFGLEGFNKSGVDVSRMINFPWNVTHELSLGVLEGGNGEDGTAFGETRRRPTTYGHLKNYVEMGEDTGFELGFTHMAGSRDEDSRFEVTVMGSDATIFHNFNADQRLKVQGEIFRLNREETEEELDGGIWGSYGLIDLKLHPRWSTGVRYDYVQLVDNAVENPDRADEGFTGYLTFHQSEFARWRLQFSHTDLATGEDDNQVMLQGTFAIGEHKHKIQ